MLAGRRRAGHRAEDGVELLEGALRPQAEAAEVAARGELQQVERVDVGELDAGDVAEGAGDAVVGVVHHKRAAALHEAAVTHLTLTGAHGLRGDDLLHVVVRAELLQQRNGIASLRQLLHRVGKHKGHLVQLLDAVAAGHHQRGHSARRQAGRDGVPPLRQVHLTMPPAPLLGRREHAAPTAHVAERTLTGAVGATTLHTRDTRDGAASAPRRGRGHLASVLVDAVRLTLVLRHVGVHEVDDIRADGRLQGSDGS